MAARPPLWHAARMAKIARRTWLRVGLAAGLAGCAAASSAAEPVRVNVDESNPPFMFGRDGKAAGVYPALMAAAFQEMRVELRIEAKPWRRALMELDAAQAGVGGIYKNTERLAKYDFSEPMYVERINVYVPAGRYFSYTRLADLEGKRVGVIRGWSYGDDFDRARSAGRLLAEEVDSDEQNFRKLAIGRIDALLAIDEAGAAQLRQHAGLRLAGTMVENPTYLAFHKSAHQAALLERFNAALARLKKSGRLESIVGEAIAR